MNNIIISITQYANISGRIGILETILWCQSWYPKQLFRLRLVNESFLIILNYVNFLSHLITRLNGSKYMNTRGLFTYTNLNKNIAICTHNQCTLYLKLDINLLILILNNNKNMWQKCINCIKQLNWILIIYAVLSGVSQVYAQLVHLFSSYRDILGFSIFFQPVTHLNLYECKYSSLHHFWAYLRILIRDWVSQCVRPMNLL